MNFRKHFDYDLKAASDETAVDAGGPSMTVQSMAEENDLNLLMHRYGITGKMPENPRVPMYGDFTNVSDYRTALHAVMEADDAFMELPANVRARFENDPQKLLEFVANDANIDEARKLGLMKPEAVKNGDIGKSADARATAGKPDPAPAGATGTG